MELSYKIEEKDLAEELIKARKAAIRNDEAYLLFLVQGLKPILRDDYYIAEKDGAYVVFSPEDFTSELLEDIIDAKPSLVTDSFLRKTVDAFLTKADESKD